ncbi:MAG: TetR/AcrR family transcriptional regulator [Myxococcaceae bacterium]|nr:TetR/AcrR family transcriptional regulator [Myxococcaceae bacterium]
MDATETRQRILEAADGLFGELGFDATTTRDIAERSGVNKALIHYHFGTKDDLLEALLERYYEQLGATMQGAFARPHKTLRAKVEDVLDTYADFLAAHSTFARIVQREVASGRHIERVVERTLPMFQLGVAWMSEALTKAPRDLDAVNLLTTVYGIVVTWFTWGEVVRRLTGKDPFSPAALEARKRHVRRVVGLLIDEVEGRK